MMTGFSCATNDLKNPSKHLEGSKSRERTTHKTNSGG